MGIWTIKSLDCKPFRIGVKLLVWKPPEMVSKSVFDIPRLVETALDQRFDPVLRRGALKGRDTGI
ncbi:hypothetical protein, partial [Rhizobium tubonense]|uniref:hypothetical protein n=1 Tax=Rhizobium tubonense TaxID=484088 RepID=UPI0019D41225